MEAQALWRVFPGQIASDLSQYHHRRIAEWHQGDMGSYELLELCEYMPDEGRLKAALRRRMPLHPWLLHPWSEPAHARFQTANELSILRSAQVPSFNSDDIGSTVFMSPDLMQDRVERQLELEEAREGVYAMADRTRHEDDDED